MKVTAAAALLYSSLTHGAGVSVKTLARVGLGPQNCVKLTRTVDTGSCVISTDCEGLDISKTEFVFDCVGPDSIVRHSFGVGGFDTNEEFDTEIKCKQCEPPLAADVVAKKSSPPGVPRAVRDSSASFQARRSEKVIPVEQRDVLTGRPVSQQEAPLPPPHAVLQPETEAQRRARTEDTVNTVTREAAATSNDLADQIDESTGYVGRNTEVVRYGPAGCVSTWRNKDSCCMIRTNCQNRDISKYEFGLICVDKVGQPVRHVFGKDSFDRQETFNTLIKCDKCLGLEDIPDALALNGEVVDMAKDIVELKDVMTNISYNVEVLDREVFSTEAPSVYGPETLNLVAKKTTVVKDAAKVALHHSAVTNRVIKIDDQQQGTQIVKKGNLRHSQNSHHQDEHQEVEEDDEGSDDKDRHGKRDTRQQSTDDSDSVTYVADSSDGSDEVQDAVIRDDRDDAGSTQDKDGDDRDDAN
jgi:hypothetical protein